MDYPKYRSHKEVSAVKIAAVDPGADDSLTLELEGGFDKVIIPHFDRKSKPTPEAGWYLVQYADGYQSFSPAQSFEEGYTPLSDEQPVEEPADEEVTPSTGEQAALEKPAEEHQGEGQAAA